MTKLDLTGKKGVVFGVANARSIAWAISQELADAGAELAFTYQTERLLEPVKKAVSSLGEPCLVECDATDPAQVEAAYKTAVAAEVSKKRLPRTKATIISIFRNILFPPH